MARAKRSDRAEARRRYRQATTTDEPVVEPSAAGATKARGSTPTAARPSITGAFRGAYRPVDLRGDVAALPQLVRHWSFWVPVILILGATGAAMVAPTQAIVILLFQALVLPPAMAGVFIVGFFARRAAYLLGGILAAIDVLAYAAFVVLASSGSIPGIQGSNENVQGQLLSAFAIGPISGVVFGAMAAWYRRFLSLSNANRPQRPKGKGSGRAGNGGR